MISARSTGPSRRMTRYSSSIRESLVVDVGGDWTESAASSGACAGCRARRRSPVTAVLMAIL